MRKAPCAAGENRKTDRGFGKPLVQVATLVLHVGGDIGWFVALLAHLVGAQRIVQDLLSGFFIITEKQYGFGDLVALTVTGVAAPAEGTVEDVKDDLSVDLDIIRNDEDPDGTIEGVELTVEDGARVPDILVDQGNADNFLEDQLRPALLAHACEKAGIPLTLRVREGYDHSYYFISTFMEDHLRWHAERLAR